MHIRGEGILPDAGTWIYVLPMPIYNPPFIPGPEGRVTEDKLVILTF